MIYGIYLCVLGMCGKVSRHQSNSRKSIAIPTPYYVLFRYVSMLTKEEQEEDSA